MDSNLQSFIETPMKIWAYILVWKMTVLEVAEVGAIGGNCANQIVKTFMKHQR